MDDFVELLLLVLCKEAYHMDQRMAIIKHEWLQYSILDAILIAGFSVYTYAVLCILYVDV